MGGAHEFASCKGETVEDHGQSVVPPCPAPLPRPRLQPLDVVIAVRPHWFAGPDAIQSIVDALLAEHSTDYSAETPRSCLGWMQVQQYKLIIYEGNLLHLSLTLWGPVPLSALPATGR